MISSEIETPRGPAGLRITEPAGPPVSLLVLGHGAGGGVDAPDLTAVHDAAVAAGVRVALVTQPYRVAGRRAPAPAGQLDEAWTAVVQAISANHTGANHTGANKADANRAGANHAGANKAGANQTGSNQAGANHAGVNKAGANQTGTNQAGAKQAGMDRIAANEAGAHEGVPRLPLIVGGRSSGARVACRTATTLGAAGVLCLAFPLHPPGKPEKSRAGELPVGVPTLVLNGDRDPFGVPLATADVEVVVRAGATHDLRKDVNTTAELAVGWLRRHGWAH